MHEGKLKSESKVYLVGGGIASLAAAAFLIRDGDITGSNIHILEESSEIGGSLDAAGSADAGYTIVSIRVRPFFP